MKGQKKGGQTKERQNKRREKIKFKEVREIKN
jgi:hypothetical protein